MDIQARKLVLIEEFLKISDENLKTKLESFLKQETKSGIDRNLNPMTLNEYHEMIDRAISDSKEGKVIPHEELKKKVKSWK
jgi:hypothetical protein